MKKYFLLFTFYFLLFTFYLCKAQDIHFSQFNYSPLTLNPAGTGNFFGDYRICLNDRNQWWAVTAPFKTISASFDTRLFTNSFSKDMFGAGIVFYSDKAGDSDFGTTEASLSMSYTKSIDPLARHYLSFGLQAGFGQRTIDFSSLTFDNQYNGYKFDPNMSSLEQFNKDKFNFPDISAGINWYYFIKERTNLNIGAAIFHINRPEQAMLENGQSKLDPRYSFNFNLETDVTEKLDIAPAILFMRQGKYQEFDIGLMLRIIKDRNINNFTSFNIGAFSRANDAANIIAGFDYKKFTVGLSYDINYSGLQKASHSQGAYEISVIYRIFKTNRISKLKAPCKIL